MHARKALLLALLFTLTFGCSSPPVPTGPRMPFHVAVIPLTEATPRQSEADLSDYELTELQLAPDLARLSTDVTGALEERCFVKTTLLEREEGPNAADAYIERARELRADMICELELEYEPAIYRASNNAWWPNFVLFGLGGPFCYFLKDQSYYATVEMTAELFDLEEITSGGGAISAAFRLGGDSALIADANAAFTQTSMNFLDRAGSSVGSYALSIVWPSGLIDHESEEVDEQFDQAIVDALLPQVTNGVLADRGEVLVGGRRGLPFELLSSEVSVSRAKDGGLDVAGTVLVDPAGRMLRWEVWAGDEKFVSTQFAEPESVGEDQAPWSFADRLATSADVDDVRLVLLAYDQANFQRTYTFPVQ